VSFKTFIVTGLLTVACLLGGCMIVWDDPIDDNGVTNPTDTVVPPPKPPLVGDWRIIYENDDGIGIDITTITAEGAIISGGFFKVDDFWIESWENIGIWQTSNDTLYENIRANGGVDALRFSISGNMITLIDCVGETCDTIVAEKVDVAAVRGRLGTVRNQDPALFTSSAYTDLMWLSESDGNDTLDFDMMYFWNGERYFGDGWYYDGYYNFYDGLYYAYWYNEDGYEYEDPLWYTTPDSRLFLILTSGGYAGKTVELTYEITGSGSDAKLSIRPILDDGSIGPEDIWLPAEYDGYGGGFHKSRHGKKFVKKRKGAFFKSRSAVAFAAEF